MKIIVAADKNWGIGKDNKLLVSIPADMKMFRQETTGKVCVMGRKNLESFPGGLPLKNRTNIVLTRNENYKVKDAIIVHSIEELMEELKKEGMWFVCADMDGQTMYDLNLTGPIGLVIGNEGAGVSRLVKEKCDFTASIPMKGDIDSLNASVAAGVLAYEIVRQRLKA